MINNEQIRQAVQDKRKVIEGGASVLGIVKHGFELRNITADEVVVAKLCKELLKKLEFSYKTLKTNELALVIDEGCFGGFGEVYGITAPTIFGWVKKYFELYAKIRNEALADYSRTCLPVTNTETENMIKWQRNIEKIFKDFKKDKETLFKRPTGYHCGASVYAFLIKLNPNIFDEEFKKQCWEKIKTNKTKFISYHTNQVNSSLFTSIRLKEQVDEKMILGLALKTYMVNEYFTALVQNGCELFT